MLSSPLFLDCSRETRRRNLLQPFRSRSAQALPAPRCRSVRPTCCILSRRISEERFRRARGMRCGRETGGGGKLHAFVPVRLWCFASADAVERAPGVQWTPSFLLRGFPLSNDNPKNTRRAIDALQLVPTRRIEACESHMSSRVRLRVEGDSRCITRSTLPIGEVPIQLRWPRSVPRIVDKGGRD